MTSKLRSVVNITNSAKTNLIKILKTHNTNAALFCVEGGGCNGLKYKLEPLDLPFDPQDEIIPLDETNELRVCGKSLIHVLGTTIDWGSDFMGQSFRFENPNAEVSCGFGATFSTKNFQ